jgi:hypothetical protein
MEYRDDILLFQEGYAPSLKRPLRGKIFSPRRTRRSAKEEEVVKKTPAEFRAGVAIFIVETRHALSLQNYGNQFGILVFVFGVSLSATPVFSSSHSREHGNLGLWGREIMEGIGTAHEIPVFTGMTASYRAGAFECVISGGKYLVYSLGKGQSQQFWGGTGRGLLRRGRYREHGGKKQPEKVVRKKRPGENSWPFLEPDVSQPAMVGA